MVAASWLEKPPNEAAAIDPKRTVMQGAAYVGSSTWRADSCRSLQVKSRDSLCENYLHLVERQ